MKNLKKQIISAAIAASSVAAVLPSAFAAVPAEVQGTRFEEPVQVLSALEIMVGDENGKFRLDDTIIRSEVTKVAIHAMGLEDAAEAAKGKTMFDDVSTEHWANGYINLAVSQGLIEGDGDGNFRPNDPITYAEAMTIMVHATGYRVSAEEKGGYPQGYIQVGTANGLGKNVQCASYEEISRGNIAYLTSNALEVNLMEQTGYGSGAKYEITDKTLLKDRLNVTKDSGQITEVENTSLQGTSNLGKNQVKIGSKVFDTAYNMNDLLGYNVDYYVKEEKNGSQEIILAMPIKNQNNELIINSELFSKLTTKNGNNAVEYFADENSSKKTVAEIAKDAVLIYNGKYADMDTALIDFNNADGSLTMLDTNKDGKYDIVFSRKFENIVVNKVTSNRVYDKYSDKYLKLDDTVDFRITNGLDEISISDLNEYDVLSVYTSLDEKLYEISVSRNAIKGKVSSKDSKGYIIDGERYQTAANFTREIPVGTEGTFYLDIAGKIAASDTSAALSSNYGYLIRAYYAKNTNNKASFKIFTKDGKTADLEGNDKIKFNGQRNVSAENVVNQINNGEESNMQLITYTVNSSDKITEINTAKDNTASGSADVNNFTLNYNLENVKFTKSQSKLGNVRIDSNTIVFEITEDQDDYAIRNIDVFEDGQSYNAMVYDMTENYTAKAIVLTSSQLSANADAPIAIVKEILTTENKDEEETDMLVALSEGKEVSIAASDKNVLMKNDAKLEKGDIIQYKTNNDNEIVSVRVLFDVNSVNDEAVNTPHEDLETVYGKVTKKFSNSVNVTVNNGRETNYVIPENVTVYSVDTLSSKNSVNKADVSDIKVYDEDENNRIFMTIVEDEVKEIVIIR